MRSTTAYDAAVGLVTVLEAAAVPPGTVHERYDNLVVRLTSADPGLVVPDLVPNPYDFTFPERRGKRPAGTGHAKGPRRPGDDAGLTDADQSR
ncbi:hypothetical protein [Georgenia faecalis]|uniref:Uncharacterized protein n=1 Tax=Georgenia faecalis TaxID=2483799 RepID=A0ABV9DAR8_9MICO|nr:hypothetical protein [Georgenia faecalis]